MHDATARNVNMLIVQRVAQVGLQSVAETLGVAPSTVSRWLSGQQGIPIERIDELFESLGLYVSDDSTITQEVKLPAAKYEALVTLAREALE